MRALISVTLALLTFGAVQAEEIELVTNGGFEAADTARSWDVGVWQADGDFAVDADATHEGEHSLRLTGGTADASVVARQRIGLLKRGEPFTLTGMWRSTVEDGLGARVVLRWLSETGDKITDEPALGAEDPFDWQQFELTVTPPPDAAGANIFLEIWESQGTVWFDAISATQSVDPPTVEDFHLAQTPDVVTVGVFDANAAGGRGFGAQGIHEALSALDGVSSELITDLSLGSLGAHDCVVLPNVHSWGAAGTPGLLAQRPELAWAGDPRACLSAYVRMGGGLILTHQSNGTSEALSPSIVPTVLNAPDKTLDPTPAEFAAHPVTAGVTELRPTFTDARIVAPGPNGTVLMRNEDGIPLAVAGEMGAGRVVGLGTCPGIDTEEDATDVSPGEAAFLANAVRWAGADDARDVALLAAPDTVTLLTPEDALALTISAVAAAEDALESVDVRLSLLDEGFAQVVGCPVMDVTVPTGGSLTVEIPTEGLDDATYYVTANPVGPAEAEVIATVENQSGYARFADTLPKPEFEWTCMNVHQPAYLDTEEEIAQMARHAKEMNFDAVLYAGKPTSARLYYNTQIGEKAEGIEDIDPLELVVKHCHEQGLQVLVQFCTFREGSSSSPSKFMQQHPEWANWNPGDGPDISEHQNGVFGCPDRPQVREYELSLMREMAENYDIDGFSFDYIRYKNDRWCVCPFSQEHFANWWEAHPVLTEAQARAKHAEEQIVSFTWEVREMLDEVKPDAILHGYCHPTWANKFPLNYLSFRASAHWTQPGRGGPWSLQRVHESSERNVDLADDHVDFMKAAPMADTGYFGHHKPTERFRRELRLVADAGAPAVMVYLYSTLMRDPELRATIAEELE